MDNKSYKQYLEDRIVKANRVKEIIDSEGFKEITNEYNILKDAAFHHLTNEDASDSEMKNAQIKFNNLSTLLKIPEIIIHNGDVAREELDSLESKKTEPSFNKKPNLYKTNIGE